MLNLPSYPYRIDPSYIDYDFLSTGPNGKIRKVARFDLMPNGIYNFAFGDLDEQSGDINDMSRSNNEDVEKVFTTLANIILDFTDAFPGSAIFIKGSTPARTRLYQIYINKHWEQIKDVFQLWGYVDDDPESFEPGTRYDAFIGRRID